MGPRPTAPYACRVNERRTVNELQILLADDPPTRRAALTRAIARSASATPVVLDEIARRRWRDRFTRLVGSGVDPRQLEVLHAISELEADAVVLSLPGDGEEPPLCGHLLGEFPELLVVALGDEDDRAVAYRRPVQRIRLDGLADDRLVATIERLCRGER